MCYLGTLEHLKDLTVIVLVNLTKVKLSHLLEKALQPLVHQKIVQGTTRKVSLQMNNAR